MSEAVRAATPDRHLTLDVIRGVAVMGILVANLPAFGLPEAAYFSPLASGGTAPGDIVAWFATFTLVEGKMRALFSLLFGASMLLVIDRAEARGDSGAAVHFRRMAVLFAIGCAHLWLVWYGDILSHYALVGAFAYMAARLPARWLVGLAMTALALQTIVDAQYWLAVVASAGQRTPEARAIWASAAASFGVPPAGDVAREIAALRGAWPGEVAWRWETAASPLGMLPLIGLETLSAMLVGMAAYRSGFLTGAWPRTRYRRWAVLGLGLALPAYALLGTATLAHGFDLRWVFLGSIVASQPVRLLAAVGYAALLILLVRPGGAMTERVAAVGRAALTNYLGTSIAMTFVFDGWGLGRFAHLDRASLYWLAPLVWAGMLAWSQPWLARFRYGPAEWVWRSLARLEPQPMRRMGP